MYDRMQLKNHWDTMSRQWKIWCMLVQTGYMSWDPETNTFGASDEEWAYYLQVSLLLILIFVQEIIKR